jgi:signal transduction histidine kinase
MKEAKLLFCKSKLEPNWNSDNGIGISEDVKKENIKIDSPVTQSGTSGEIGTGLGLILCKEFVDKHGTIWVESVLGKGCDANLLPV